MPGTLKPLTNPRTYVIVALIGTLAASLLSFAAIVVGSGGPNVVAFGIVTTTLFVFILTLHASYGKGDNKEDFLRKGSVRTAIATSMTVAYVMFLAFSLTPQLGLTFSTGIFANFQLVYIFTIGFYFGTATLERVVEILKKQSSLFGS